MATKKKAPKKASKRTPVKPISDASKRAKKGWVTRRRNAVKKTARETQKKVKQNAKRLANAAKAQRKKPRVKPVARLDLKGKTKKQLDKIARDLERQNREQEARLREQEEQIARQRAELQARDADDAEWVSAFADEYISAEDGHICVEPSRLRYHEDHDIIQERLDKAYAEGEFEFDAECALIAMDYDVDIREVYTMFKSP